MRISSIQQGLIVEREFAKYLMIGSGGRIEVDAPLSDDERRDLELHIRGFFGLALTVQAKSAMALRQFSANTHYLEIHFEVVASRLVSNPSYWYFLAYLDPNLMRLGNPTFLVPSKVFHELAAPSERDGVWRFTMAASMDPGSRDRWHPYRVDTLEVGTRMLEIIRDLKKRRAVWVPPAA